MPDPKSPKTQEEQEAERKEKERLDAELDEQLEDSFPASDPPKVTRVPADAQITGDDE